MVGRREVLDRLLRAMSARAGPAGVVITGPAGVGKTRLLVEARRRALAAGAHVPLAVATPATATIPFGPLAHLLPPGAAGDFPAVVAAATGHLRGDGRRAVVLAVDDAHLLDPGSLALVQHLALGGAVGVVATARAGEPGADALAPLWRSGLVERLDLAGLDDDEVAQAVTGGLGGAVEGVLLGRPAALSGGNPLLLRELVDAGVADGAIAERGGLWRATGPLVGAGSLPAMIAARLDRLDARARAAAELVALAEPIGAGVLESLLPADAVAALEDAGLLAPVPDRRRQQVRLVHPLYAETLRATVPPLRAREHRRRLADALAATGMRRQRDRVQVALWRLDAGRRDDPDLFLQAAREASGARDHALAARLAEAAVAAGGGFPAELALIAKLPYEGRAEEALSRLAALEPLAPDEAARARIAQLRAHLYLLRGDAARADAVLAAAVAYAADPEQADWLRADHAGQAFALGAVARSLELGEPVLARPAAHPGAVGLLVCSRVRALCCAGRPLDALALVDHGLDLVDDLGPRGAARAAELEMTRLQALPYAGRPREALVLAGRRVADCRSGTDAARLPYWELDLGHVLRMVGHAAEARRAFRETLATTPVDGVPASWQLWGLDGLAEACALLGADAEAAAAVARLEAVLPAGVHALTRSGTVWTAAARGELSLARDLARRYADELGEAGALMQRAWTLHDAARLGADVVAELADVAERCQGPLPSLWAAHAAALAAGDAAGLDRVSAAFDERGFDLWAAEAVAAAGRLHRRAGRTGSALAAELRAAECAARCPGVRTPLLAQRDGSTPLTAREHEVAGLAARGLSDRDIAARLHLSVRTVHTHLHQAYRKLDVAGRAERAAAGRRTLASWLRPRERRRVEPELRRQRPRRQGGRNPAQRGVAQPGPRAAQPEQAVRPACRPLQRRDAARAPGVVGAQRRRHVRRPGQDRPEHRGILEGLCPHRLAQPECVERQYAVGHDPDARAGLAHGRGPLEHGDGVPGAGRGDCCGQTTEARPDHHHVHGPPPLLL